MELISLDEGLDGSVENDRCDGMSSMSRGLMFFDSF
jgi:hypothetical protein